eukprot:57261-Pyramimonas_sp.AAC.1
MLAGAELLGCIDCWLRVDVPRRPLKNPSWVGRPMRPGQVSGRTFFCARCNLGDCAGARSQNPPRHCE